ncbi:MAG: hypothetical protein IJF07_04405 [Lachnospiraceae bacterium]|nr:hypothetical protein [Lachnospiraceae bacterium]
MSNAVQIEEPQVYKAVLKAVKAKKKGLARLFLGKVTMEDALDLKELRLEHITVRNLDFLNYFPNLERLTLESVKELQSIEGIANCTGLKNLACYETRIDDFTPLLSCRELEYFDYMIEGEDMSPCRSDFDFLKEFPNLQCIDLTGNLVEDVTFLGECKAMEQLILDNNPVTSIAPLKMAPKLNWLEVQNGKLTSLDDIAEFQALECLFVKSNAFGADEIEEYRKKFSYLKILELEESDTENSLKQINKMLDEGTL